MNDKPMYCEYGQVANILGDLRVYTEILLSPHYLYKPTIMQDGDQWCALLGENSMVGVAGFGKSPAEACAAFDKAWYEKLTTDGKE